MSGKTVARALIAIGAVAFVLCVLLSLAAIWTDGVLQDRLGYTAFLAGGVGFFTLMPALISVSEL